MSTKQNIFYAFLAGAAAGGAAAILMAPDKGSETRRRLRTSADRIKTQGQEKIDEVSSTAQEKAGEITENVRDRVGGTVDSAKTTMEAVRKAVSEGKKAYYVYLEEAPNRDDSK